ncbi:Type II secretion system (T2SS), protein F [uncultured archaeon]|nr:Type II secretion system (T2SS), protein F [uncultured archaeon]
MRMASSNTRSQTPAFELVGRLFGRERIRRLGAFLHAGGYSISPESFAGIYLVASLLLSLGLSISLAGWFPLKQALYRFSLLLFAPLVGASSAFVPTMAIVLSFVGSFALIGMLAYVVVRMAADSRRAKVEEILPDFLLLAAANVRAGMTVDQALWYAAKPEFGTLSTEVQVVAKRTFGGEPFDKAIDHLSEHFNSKFVRRTVTLIKQGLSSGGQIAEILERTAKDVRDMQIIKKDIAASLLMYIIFLVFAASVGAPFLFSVSAKLIALLEHVFAQIPDTSSVTVSSGMSFIQPQAPVITSEQFLLFVTVSTIVTAVCSALMIGIINKGNRMEGVRYIPPMLIASFVIFLIVSALLDTFLASMGTGSF